MPRMLPLCAAVIAASASTLCWGTAAQAAPVAPKAAMQILSGDVIPGLAALAPLQAVDPSTSVEIALPLADAQPAAKAAYLKAEYTAGSPDYHRFLTPAQVTADFGPTTASFDAAISFGTSQGLTVLRASTDRSLVMLTGTAAQAEKTFQVSIGDYTWHGLNFYANSNEPTVPTGLGIIGVVGLNNAQVMHDDPHTIVQKSGTSQSDCAAGVCLGATTPQDLWGSYDQPSGDEGQGQSLAMFGEGDYTAPIADLRLFEAANTLPAVPVRVVEVDGQTAAYTDTSGDEEWDIDTQSSTGMAPDVQALDMYFGTSLTDADTLNVADDWASDPNGPLQASASYGECEYDPAAASLPTGDFAAGGPYTVSYEQTMQDANLEGRTLFSSAGDDGSSCPVTPIDTNGVATQGFPDVNYPCASPEVVCVGGTVLYTTGATPDARALETAWTESGGGSSLIFGEPTFQDSEVPGVVPCLYTDTGATSNTGTPCRGVPDIAAQSGDVATNGYAIYYDGAATEEGGTSLSSPLSLGMWTRVQSASTASGANGYANPIFYKDNADFYDIGNPTDTPPSAPTTNSYFVSTPGWDYVSGLGVMDVSKLTTTVDGTLTPFNDEASPNTPTITVVDGTNGYQTVSTTTGGSGGSTSTVDPACVPLFLGTTGESAYPPDAGTDYPQLDVLQGNMHNTDSSASTAGTLTGILTVEDMETGATAVPAGGTAIEYYLTWTFDDTEYFLNAEVSATGNVFNYGTQTTTGGEKSLNTVGTATGTIVTGTDGTITMSIPLSDIGSPTSGSVLTEPAEETDVLEGVPSNPTSINGGELLTASTVAPEYNYTLDEVCAATGLPGSDGAATGAAGDVPEAPYAVLIPIVGLAAFGGVSWARRRRRAART